MAIGHSPSASARRMRGVPPSSSTSGQTCSMCSGKFGGRNRLRMLEMARHVSRAHEPLRGGRLCKKRHGIVACSNGLCQHKRDDPGRLPAPEYLQKCDDCCDALAMTTTYAEMLA